MADDAELRISITDNTPSGSRPRAGDREGGYRDPQGRWRNSQTHRFATDPDSTRRVGASPSGGRTGSNTPSKSQERKEARDRGEGLAKALARALGRYIGGTTGRMAGGTFGRVLGSAAGNVIGNRAKNAVTSFAARGLAGGAAAAGGGLLAGAGIAAGVATTAATLLQIQRTIEGKLVTEIGKLNGQIAMSLGQANLNETLAKIDQANELADELSTFIDRESQISIAIRELQTSLINFLSPAVTAFQEFIINFLRDMKALVEIANSFVNVKEGINKVQGAIEYWFPAYAEMMKEVRDWQAAVERGRKRIQRREKEKMFEDLESLIDDTIEETGMKPVTKRQRQRRL